MKSLPWALGVGLVATACAGAPVAGPGTTAPIVVDDPVTSPPAEIPPLTLELVVDGLDQPVALTERPGDDRIYVAERPGRVVMVDEGEIVAEPFVDLTDEVYGPITEQGLLGISFDSDGNRLFAVFTDESEDVFVKSYPVEGDTADRQGERTLMRVEQPHMYHQGGALMLGPDGYLWIGLGDGGGTGDPFQNGQDPGTRLGAILRIDVDAAQPYAIPPDNPFVSRDDGAPEVWAYGLRNPWRFAFDAGHVYIADVGQYEQEELNIVRLDQPGMNFGWPIREGDSCFEADECAVDGLTDPTVVFPHDRLCALVGGPVYRGEEIPELEGHYFYADFCLGWIRSLVFDGETVVAKHDWEAELGRPGQITTFGTDPSGELLVATLGGSIHRVAPASGD